MESQKPSVSPLRHRMIDDMRMRKFGEKTQLDYVRAVRKFAQYLKRSPDSASVEELRNYQLHLVDHGVSPASLNSSISGLKFFFTVTLSRPELVAKMQPVHLPRKLPVILSPEEVKRLIAAAGNLKHRTALALAYATGLRVNEVVALGSCNSSASTSSWLTREHSAVAITAARLRVGGVRQAPVRRSRSGAGVSVALYPPGGDLEPAPGFNGHGRCDVPMEGLPRQGAYSEQNDKAACRGVHAPLPPARAGRRLPPHSPLRIAGQRRAPRQLGHSARIARRATPRADLRRRGARCGAAIRLPLLWRHDARRRNHCASFADPSAAMNDAMLLLCHYAGISRASASGSPMPRAHCCPSPPQRRILLLRPCPDVIKGDDSGTRSRYIDGLGHRTMPVSAVMLTFKSP